MADGRRLSRRGVVLGGGAALVTAAAGTALALGRSTATGAGTAPMPVPTVSPTASATPSPAADVDALGTVPLSQLGAPARMQTFAPLSTPAVMQDLVLVPATGTWFVTQKINGSNGTMTPYESTVVNRVRAADGVTLDAMVLVDGGHGLGFEAEADGDTTWIWMTWHGASADSGGREQDFVRLRYAPGTWTRGAANEQLGLTLVAFQDRTPEAVYHFDAARDTAVERHFNPPSGAAAPTETFIRRRLSDVVKGVDDPLDRILLRATPPTTQGFATMNGTLFRWLGANAVGGVQNPADPIVLEQYSWATGQLVATGAYPTIQQPWNDGTCEPQGLSVYREPDGTGTLVLGNVTGGAGNHTWSVSAFKSIGTA